MIQLPRKPINWPAAERETFEERAAIMEYHGLLSRAEAEKQAEKYVRDEYAKKWSNR